MHNGKDQLDSGSIGSSPVPSYRRLINILVTPKDELPHLDLKCCSPEKKCQASRGDYPETLLPFGFICENHPSCLKVRGGVVGWWPIRF